MERDPALINLQGLNQWTTSYTLPAFKSALGTLNGGNPIKYFLNYMIVSSLFKLAVLRYLYCSTIILFLLLLLLIFYQLTDKLLFYYYTVINSII